MNNNQKLTGIVLFVVTIVFMFGLHITFLLVETAQANHSSSTCSVKLHRVYGTSITKQLGVLMGHVTVVANCSDCAGSTPKKHRVDFFYDKEIVKMWYEHKHLIGLSWSDCHVHTSARLLRIYSQIVTCGYT